MTPPPAMLAQSSVSHALGEAEGPRQREMVKALEEASRHIPLTHQATPQGHSALTQYLVGDGPGIMSHGEDGKGQLGLGVARVVAMVILALLQEGVVRGLMRGRDAQASAGVAPLAGLCLSPLPHKTTALNTR